MRLANKEMARANGLRLLTQSNLEKKGITVSRTRNQMIAERRQEMIKEQQGKFAQPKEGIHLPLPKFANSTYTD